MSTVNPDIDLGAFARQAPAIRRPRRRILRFVVPLSLLVGFAGILFASLGDAFRSEVPVTVLRPIPATARRAAGAVLFEASGWVEPDPFPILVTPLAPGTIHEVLVQESQVVAAGDPIARLVDEDARLALEAASAALKLAIAEREQAEAELRFAIESFDANLELLESTGVAEADFVGKRAEAEHRAAAVRKGDAALTIAREELELQRYLEKERATGPRQVELALARVAEAEGELEILKADSALAVADAEKAAARRTRVRRDLELRLADRLRVASAKAAMAAAEAKIADAKVRRDEAELRLQRMTVRAPAGGVVLARLAMPGLAVGMGPESRPICSLYEPTSIRVRVDVPQEEVAQAFPDQQALVLSKARSAVPYRGTVIRIVQESDINKVTLQVHVRVLDPDELLRPEMLCTVRFLAPAPSDDEAVSHAPAVKVPARLVVGGNGLWVIDGERREARLRRVELGAREGDWVVVLLGINMSDKLIDEGRGSLKERTRVSVKENE